MACVVFFVILSPKGEESRLGPRVGLGLFALGPFARSSDSKINDARLPEPACLLPAAAGRQGIASAGLRFSQGEILRCACLRQASSE
ncbi:MAG TPA: hypothetical protein VJN90_05700, partial [Candidatus Acidoferrales bacterium]|nr:hypothetical protein [Candidatus Acidoferrales bacterium]